MNITLIGAGMGGWRALTQDALEALGQADAAIGAERLLGGLPPDLRAVKVAQALPEKVADAICLHPEWRDVCVLLSGDVGFHSGAKRLLELLEDHDPRLLPGISTPQYFAARLRRPWQDFHLVSAHGVQCDILAEVLNHQTVLFLVGGDVTPSTVATALCDAGLGRARMTVGENLSYPDERIVAGTAAELAGRPDFAPLAAVLVDNGETFARDVRVAGIPDDDFIRGETPMTKREVRAIALSHLNLRPDDIVYDIGAGTGSVSVEAALHVRWGRVFAIERDENAYALLGKNRERFGVYNMLPIPGTAPEALEPLPPPRAAFIGGSGGRMRAIVAAVLAKNPRARLVAAAISLETLASATAAMGDASLDNVEVVQIAANRAVLRGGHHMLEARNPVFLVSGGGV